MLKTTADLMPKVLESIGITPENFQIASLLEDSLSKVSKSAKVIGFKKNQFYVEVESSIELHELYLRKREILKMIQQFKSEKQSYAEPQIKFLLQGMVQK